MRRTMGLFGSLALCLVLVVAFWPAATGPAGNSFAQETPAKTRPAESSETAESNNEVTKQKLARRIQIEFQDQPLQEVMAFLEGTLDVQLIMQRQELEAAGVPLDAPITLKLKRVRGDMLLDLALRQASPSIGYVVRDGIVIIANRDALSEHLTIRVYNCRDLLSMATPVRGKAASAEGASLPGGEHPAQFGGAAMGGVPAGPGSGGFPGGGGIGVMRSPEVEQLVRLVQTTVAPDTWDTNGGPGTMEEFSGLLVVNQTEEVHDRIEKLLQMVRDAAEAEPVNPGR